MSASVSRIPRLTPEFEPGLISENRNVLAGVVGGWRDGIGIAAVVGGKQQQVAWLERVAERAQQLIEFFQRARESFHVLAMAIKHIEIHQIGKN